VPKLSFATRGLIYQAIVPRNPAEAEEAMQEQLAASQYLKLKPDCNKSPCQAFPAPGTISAISVHGLAKCQHSIHRQPGLDLVSAARPIDFEAVDDGGFFPDQNAAQIICDR